MGLFVLMGERQRTGGETALILSHFPYDRDEEEIPEVTLAGAAQMGVGEAENQAVGVMITGHPAIRCVRTQLYKTERSCCSRISVPVKGCTDKWIDFLGRVRVPGAS